jgi:hypothetical protein
VCTPLLPLAPRSVLFFMKLYGVAAFELTLWLWIDTDEVT